MYVLCNKKYIAWPRLCGHLLLIKRFGDFSCTPSLSALEKLLYLSCDGTQSKVDETNKPFSVSVSLDCTAHVLSVKPEILKILMLIMHII